MIDWVLDPKHVSVAGWILALGTPLAAVWFLAATTPERKQWCRRSGFFWIAAASGPLLAALWFLSDGIVGLFGLDSLVGLLIHLLLFAVTGILIGGFLRWSLRRKPADAIGNPPDMGKTPNGSRERKGLEHK